MSPAVRAALNDARQALDELYGDRLVKVVLYGSQARGEAYADSDVDVLVVLQEPFDVAREIKRVVPIECELLSRYAKVVHLMPFAAEQYLDDQHPLMINVSAEGIEL